jgi:hypothetical protein
MKQKQKKWILEKEKRKHEIIISPAQKTKTRLDFIALIVAHLLIGGRMRINDPPL